MPLEKKYNLKSPGVKRLMREARELAEPTEEYYAHPLEDNLFEWHFTVRGPPNTEFEGGFYHGRILLPTQYPMQPPNIILLTPNGRFEVNKKICLSISGHHPESWQPSWSIRTALLALIAFMPTPAAGTIGSLDYSSDERQQLARKSRSWECELCGRISESLSNRAKPIPRLTKEENCLLQQVTLKAEDDANKEDFSLDRTDSSDILQINDIRPRVTSSHSTTMSQPTVDIQLQRDVSLHRSTIDQVVTAAVWLIVFVIAVLVGRRFYFLE